MNKKKKHKQGIAVPSWLKQFLRLVEGLSPELGMRVAAHIFSKPLKFKLPEKERKALKHCQSEGIKIQEINETIRCFEWENKEQVWEKVKEEENELFEAIKSNNKEHIEEELGDYFFSIVNF